MQPFPDSSDPVSGADRLVQRVQILRQKAIDAQRVGESFSSEGVLFEDGVILYLDGELSQRAAPCLEALLDRVISRGLESLMVDLSQASLVSPEALDVIEAHRADVDNFEMRLPAQATKQMLHRRSNREHEAPDFRLQQEASHSSSQGVGTDGRSLLRSA